MPFTQIFANEHFNAALQANGYAVVPFLSADEIKLLTDFFYSHHSTLPEGMYASSHSPDFDFRKRMNEEIKRICQRAIKETFTDALPLGATFMVKSKGESGSLHPHQDWSIVDETQFNSYNIWLPLVDVNEENGTLLILPDSHKLFNNIRGLNIPSSFEKVEKEVWQYLVPLNMKAGEALVYDHRLLHASGINKTEQPRLVIVYGIIPAKAEMRYYFGNNGNIEEYACTPEFYFNENITSGPGSLKQLRSSPNSNVMLEANKLHSMYGRQQSVLQKFLGIFR
ncbi:MAG: phytanoyl-CoA dioxygenase family protein [Chitinophagales bacterium]|nr:phytanoyl-CoA dioxygenase family protein [Chitinophagales bacterium]